MRRAPGGAGFRGRGPGFQVEVTHASGASAGPGRAGDPGRRRRAAPGPPPRSGRWGDGDGFPAPRPDAAGGAFRPCPAASAPRSPEPARPGGREPERKGERAEVAWCGRREEGRQGRRRRREPCRTQLQAGRPRRRTDAARPWRDGVYRGPGPATGRRRRRSPFGPREMRVSVAAPRGGGAGPARSRGVAVAGAAAAEPRHPARPEPPRPAEWRRGRGTRGHRAPGPGAERAGPALSHRGRLGPGRAAAPDAGSGRPGLDYALGKSPIHRRRRRPCGAGLFPSRDRAGAAALGPGHFGRARLASCGDPHGAPGLVPLPLGVASPRSGADSCSPVGSGFARPGSCGLAAFRFPACIVATVQVAIIG